MKRALAVITLAIAALSANAGRTFHPITCTTEYCCLTTNPADNNCCKTYSDPCPIH